MSKKGKRKRISDDSQESAMESTGKNQFMDFASASPTVTHRAITKLIHLGIIRFCITQNVDGLHQRSGLSRKYLAVLHGCAFTEKCEDCGTEYFRDNEVNSISFQLTGTKCSICSGSLRDTLLDWEDPLPEEDIEKSEFECENADLVLCLGTSLRIYPANQMPLKAKKFVIVNLQQTMMDDTAALIIREKVDTVLMDVLEALDVSSLNDANESVNIERVWKPSKVLDVYR